MAWLADVMNHFKRSNLTPLREEGRAALREGRLADAVTALRKHLRLRPRDAHSWLRLGNALKDLGLYDDADTAFRRSCALRPRSAEAWRDRGRLMKLLAQDEQAAIYFQRSFALNGDVEAGRELLRLAPDMMVGSGVRPVAGCVDGVMGGVVFGWAVDPSDPSAPAEIEVLQGEVQVGVGQTSLPRMDVAAAGLAAENSGFRIKLGSAYRADHGPLVVRLAVSKEQLANSPYKVAGRDEVSAWLERWRSVDDARLADLRKTYDGETEGLLLSIIMPVYNPPLAWLQEAIDSVLAQVCTRWELICVDDASPNPDVLALLTAYSQKDSRIRVISMPSNGGISRSTNAGLEDAGGEFVAFMDHDDALEPEAVYRVLDAAKHGCDLIYSDEVICGQVLDEVIDIVVRPAFSYDYYISHPYFVHFVAVRTDLARSVDGLDVDMSISMDVDFILRVIEGSHAIAHVPSPLYRWRTHPNSVGHEKVDAVMAATRGSLERHHRRLGLNVVVKDGPTFNTFRHEYSCDNASVLVIVPTKDRLDLIKPCVESILSTTSADVLIVDHESTDPNVLEYFDGLSDRVKFQAFSGPFNFSTMNNNAVDQFGGEYDLFLFANNDLEAIEPGWLEHMAGLCLRGDVGAVGALLLYKGDTVQHGGVVLGVGGPAEHVYKNAPFNIGGSRNPGHISGLVSVRDYMAVTGACLMMRADVFHRVGGFDDLLAIGFNDIDLCLRVREAGFKVLFDGHAVLHHYESATRSKSKQLRHPEDTSLMADRWVSLLARPDPYFSPLFGREAPANQAIVKPIDPYEPIRLWRRPAATSVTQGRARRVAPPVIVM